MASSDLRDGRGSGDWEPTNGRVERPVPSEMLSLSELELELVRVRSEARAARFEARAAELELEARRRTAAADEGVTPTETGAPVDSSADRRPSVEATSAKEPAPAASWAALAAAAEQRRAHEATLCEQASKPPSENSNAAARERECTRDERTAPCPDEKRGRPNPGPSKACHEKPDSSQTLVGRSRVEGEGTAAHEPAPDAARRGARRQPPSPRKADQVKLADAADAGKRGRNTSAPTPRSRKSSQGAQRAGRDAAIVPATVIAAESEPRPLVERRRKPAAWLASVLMHLVVLVLLAALTLSVPEPQDQLAFSASAAPAASEPLELLTIEPVDPSSDLSEQAPAEEAVRVDPLGKMPPAPSVTTPSSHASAIGEPMALSDALSTTDNLKLADAEMTTQFCGVAGGGNHFCYVVDSSQSMSGGRFESARAELLRSIDQLTAEQRFYIIFYDSNLDRMCVTQPGQPDEHSVSATTENKRAVRRWAMQVGLERGAPPADALEFAFGLRPDVIFLLSDGEFPQRIEDLVAELNRDDSLFGDQGPRTILHTIGYHSRAGEARMRRLAAANGGQYRYVPEP